MSRTDWKRWGAAAASTAAISLGIVLMLYWGSRFLLPHNYSYHEEVATNGVKLHSLVVRPEYVRLQAADRPLGKYRLYGINGGFFIRKRFYRLL